MAALQVGSDIRWYDRALADLYPPFAAAPFAQRRQWIQEGILRASGFDLNRSEILQFLCFEQTFTPGCLDTPSFAWARRILAEPGKPSADRVKLLRQQSIRRLLETEARESQTEESEGGELQANIEGVEQELEIPVP
jgi:hypothetical protein